MDRRTFLKRSTLFVSGVAFSGIDKMLFVKMAVDPFIEDDYFSLEAVTDAPEESIPHLQMFFQQSFFRDSVIRLAEYQLTGIHIADMVFTRNQNLIDYRLSRDVLSENLLKISRKLGLPRQCENPTLLRFDSGKIEGEASRVRVLRGNRLIDELPLDRDMKAYHTRDIEGKVSLSIQNRSVRIIDSSCEHKTCMRMRPISRSGEHLICIPNQMMIYIPGESASGVDSSVY